VEVCEHGADVSAVILVEAAPTVHTVANALHVETKESLDGDAQGRVARIGVFYDEYRWPHFPIIRAAAQAV